MLNSMIFLVERTLLFFNHSALWVMIQDVVGEGLSFNIFLLIFIINQMRLINRNIYPLHIWKVSDYIKQAQTNLHKEDVSQFITMQNIFKKLYFRHLHQYQKLQKQTNRLNNFVKMAPTPARSIADYFHKRSKYYWQDNMRATFESIAQAYQVSKRDNAGSLDNLGYSLFLSSEFTNLSEEFKYALRNNKVSFANLTAILQSLIKLQYIDYEIINLVLLYIKRDFEGGDPYSTLSGWSGDREYQIQKKDYYNPLEIETLDSLRKSSQVQTAISLVKHFYAEAASQQQQLASIKQYNVEELNKLIDQVAETNKNFRKIVEGIINIRKEYAKMVEFSSDQQVLRNPNLNLGLLQVQEKLLALKILDIYDIHHVQQMKNGDYQVKRVEEILLLYLDVKRLDPIFTFVDKSPIQAQNYEDSTEVNPKKMSTLLNQISRLAVIDRFVYHSADGRSLANLKWQKTLIEQFSAKTIPGNPYKQELNVSRIFRRVYQQVLKTFNTYDEKINSVYKKANVQEKVLILDALCRMGLHQSAIVQAAEFESEEFLIEFNALSAEHFAIFVSLFNEIGLFINNQQLKQALYRKLQENIALQQQNLLNYDLVYSINAINYLLQNHRNHINFTKTYHRYLQKLQQKATYYTPTESQNESVVQAFKILALQIPQKYGYHPVYLNYLNGVVNGSYKKNPYLAILRETCYKLCDKEHWLRKMQVYLNIGVKNGVQNGLLFSNSDETSLDGEFRSGNLNSFIIRLQTKNNIKIHQFSINSFLNINLESNKMFQIKPFAELQQRFQEIFEDQGSQASKSFKELENSVQKLLFAFKQSMITNQIRFKLNIVNKLLNNNSNLQTKEQEITNSVAFLLQILELNKLILLLKEEDIQQRVPKPIPTNISINDPLQISSNQKTGNSDWLPVDVQATKVLLRLIKTNIPDIVAKLAQLLKYPQLSTSSPKLKGQRQTLQTLSEQNLQKKISFEEEFINYRYYSDNTFCQYNDWKEKIEKQFNMAQINQENLSDLSKILTNRLCEGISNKITLLPICKHFQLMKRVKLQFKLIKDQTENAAQTKLTAKESKELDYIINLQNFKHQLKTTFKPKQLLDYIFGFKFIFQLNKKGEDRQSYLLNRDPVEYFNYLEELHERTYMESPYVKYILSKISKTDNIKRLMQHRKKVRITQRHLYQKGAINSKTYYQNITVADNLIIEAVEQLKTKMLDHMQDAMLDGQFKMLDIKKDELQAFQSIIKKNINYHRLFDQDFIYANGNYHKALNLKRGRAQNNYIKLYLIKKITEKKTLNVKQLQYLKSWEQDIAQSINKFNVYQQYTNMLISQLPWEDLQLLKLKQTSLNASRDMPVIDLIMEFSLFLDDSLIGAYEKQLKAQLLSKKYATPQYLFEQSTAVGFKKLQNQIQQAIINQKCRLKTQEIDKLQEIFKIFKTEGYKERNRYAILCARFRQNVERMNKNYLRSNFIQEYIRLLQEQFMSEYYPELVRQIKQKQADKLWREVFYTSYDDCNTDMLKKISKKIIIRLELLGEKTPPFFGNMIFKLLLHPKLDTFTKESLIAAIQYYKFDLKLDSGDIQALTKLKGREVRESSAVLSDLRLVSSSNIGKELLKQTSLLI